MVQTIARFYGRTLVQPGPTSERDKELWHTLATYDRLRPRARSAQECDSLAVLVRWRDEQIAMTHTSDWEGSNSFRRWIPDGVRLPPALRAGLSHVAERMAVRWYLNRIPSSPLLSEKKNE